MKSILFITIVILLVSTGASSQTMIYPGSPINGHWNFGGSPYIVQGDIEIAVLQIDPGVEVLIGGDYQINILGLIDSRGAPGDSIVFSAADTVDSWKGLIFDGSVNGSSFEYCIFRNGSSNVMSITNTELYFNNCLFEDNSSDIHGGAVGIYMLTSDGVVQFEDCNFKRNFTYSSHGGAIYANMEVGELNLVNCKFIENNSNENAGDYNTVGGAIYFHGSGNANVKHCSFIDNVNEGHCYPYRCDTTARGGAIFSSGIDLVIENCDFRGNQNIAHEHGGQGWSETAYSYGGSVYISSGTAAFSNCVFGCNSVAAYSNDARKYGSAVFINNGSVSFENVTMVSNSGDEALYRGSGSASVINSIFWGNNDGNDQIHGTVDVTYCDVQNGYLGEGNFDIQPIFIGAEDCEDLRLFDSETNACIDAGNPDHIFYDTNFPPSLGGFRNDVGAFGGPGAFIYSQPRIGVDDIADDQGYELNLTWPRFEAESISGGNPISTYSVQRMDTEWTELAVVSADGSASYSQVISVEESYVIDTYWPYYLFRVVGQTGDPDTDPVSNTNIGMAIDNISPQAPYLLLSDDIGYRRIMQLEVDLESIQDFQETCIFRGEILGMAPYVFGEATLWDEQCFAHDVPPVVPCTSETGLTIWEECHRGLFYYIGRHTDIHGNFGAFGDTLIPHYPTGVDDFPVAQKFFVEQNTPNPFNPSTTIKFTLSVESSVTLDIYSVDGKKVATLVNEVLSSGPHQAIWNGNNDKGQKVSSGMYFYKVTAGEYHSTHRMLLLK